MSDKIKDGGPAFPVQETVISDSTSAVPAATGMSLRDWFAGMALQGIITSCNDPLKEETKLTTQAKASIAAYMIADEMLKQRDK